MTHLDADEQLVLKVVGALIEANDGPLTAERIASRAGLTVDATREAVATLCARGLIATRDTTQPRDVRVSRITYVGHVALKRMT
jgi:predicted transcriptional regulator